MELSWPMRLRIAAVAAGEIRDTSDEPRFTSPSFSKPSLKIHSTYKMLVVLSISQKD